MKRQGLKIFQDHDNLVKIKSLCTSNVCVLAYLEEEEDTFNVALRTNVLQLDIMVLMDMYSKQFYNYKLTKKIFFSLFGKLLYFVLDDDVCVE
jgi:hypothetical protein